MEYSATLDTAKALSCNYMLYFFLFNQYVLPLEELELPFTIESFKSLLKGAAIGKKQPTHEQIAYWAVQFFLEYEEGDLEFQNNPSIDKAIDIAYDIETEWSMFFNE